MAHVARAAVDAMAYQTRDVLEAMQAESRLPLTTLKVDGGAAANAMLLQFQADLLERLGATAGRGRNDRARRRVPRGTRRRLLGRPRRRDATTGRSIASSGRRWTPRVREKLYAGWKKAVTRSLDWES